MFDLDGTLIDSSPDLAQAINHMLEKMHLDSVSKKDVDGWLGNGAQMLVKRALTHATEDDTGLKESTIAEALDMFLTYYGLHVCETTQCYPQVPETLSYLKTEGFSMAIITNKPMVFVAPILDTLGLSGFFDQILGGDSLAKKKPDPLPLEHMMASYGVSSVESIMVGDSKNDILAARAADVESIAVTYGYNYAESVTLYRPDYAIDQFSQMIVSK